MVNGNTSGLKEYVLENLDKLYNTKIEKGKIISQEIVEYISDISNKINREINIAIDRSGNIIDISIGDSSTVNLPVVPVYDKKLSGVRIIHTHPEGNPHLSSVDISALIKLKLDCIVSIGVSEEGITGYEVAICSIVNDELSYDRTLLKNLDDFDYLEEIKEVEESLRKRNITEDDKEYALLIGIDEEEYLDELEELASACDVEVVGKFFQKRSKPDPVFLIGSGKIQELALTRQVRKANLLIFDEELSGLQLKMIEEVTGCKVIDRTTLILEIFARRARTREAKLQVELAQLKYRSNRLIGFGVTMSRLGGGVGTKGPGEKKLEIDRRVIKKTISYLNNELENIKKVRNTQRSKREDSGIPRVSLVGYTNVGKSTLRNVLVDMYQNDKTLKKDEVLSQDMLFATLDTTTRTIELKDKRIVSLTDTVGFIQKLPHDLVESFKSTLEEVIFSDLIIHVADISSKNVIEQIEAVEKVLEELNCLDKTKILLLNKIDNATKNNSYMLIEQKIDEIKEKYSNYQTLIISAKNRFNIDELMELIKKNLKVKTYDCKLLIPYTSTEVAARVHRNAIVKSESFVDEGIVLEVVMNEKEYNKFKDFILN
ncbi:GTPase HflX [Fusobacterium hwasookii]|uniref:GTPase HflX n=1 Tax=Fusobacterium hwasookii ChDC F128 TaxID=1216362 RepID=A0ABN0H2I1_9FUSO|nr:GTPase HflX [Fusobacterium hwasookii]EJU08487.1 GTP-binding protein [Fusobacterium hwasookii ChDC F128]